MNATLDALLGLADRSLLVVADEGPPTRYRLLEPIRGYARARLHEAGDEGSALDRLAAYMRRWIGSLASSDVDTLEVERANIDVALLWGTEGGDGVTAIDIGIRASRLWLDRGPLSHGRSMLRRALIAAADASPDLRARALINITMIALRQGDIVAAREGILRLEGPAQEAGGPTLIRALHVRGNVAHVSGDYEGARRAYDEALEGATAAGDAGHQRALSFGLGNVAHAQRRYADADEAYERSLDLALERGDAAEIAACYHGLSTVAAALGDHERTRTVAEHGWEYARASGDLRLQRSIKSMIAGAALELGDLDAARALYLDVLNASVAEGDELGAGAQRIYLSTVALLQGDPAEALALATDALSTFSEQRAPLGIEGALLARGAAAMQLGRLDVARSSFISAYERAVASPDEQVEAAAIEGVAATIADQAPAAAARLLGAAARMRDHIGVAPMASSDHVRARAWELAVGKIGEGRAAAEKADGQGSPVEDVRRIVSEAQGLPRITS